MRKILQVNTYHKWDSVHLSAWMFYFRTCSMDFDEIGISMFTKCCKANIILTHSNVVVILHETQKNTISIFLIVTPNVGGRVSK
jgi:hypothetical protein